MKKRFRWDAQYLYWGITAFCVIMCGVSFFLIVSQWPVVRGVLNRLLGILSPVIYGLMLAYLFNKIMTFLERRLISRFISRVLGGRPEKNRRRAARIISVALTMLLAMFVISGALTLILPQIYSSLQTLVSSMDSYFNTVVKWLRSALEDNSLLEDAAINITATIIERISNWIESTVLTQADRILANVIGGVFGVIKTLANLLIGFVISIYVMYHKEEFSAQAKKVIYGTFKMKRANKLIAGAEFLDKTCGSFITSKLIDSTIVGIVCYLVMIVLKMPYPMLVSVIIGVTNIIPFFGPFIGGIPSAVLILLADPSKGFLFVMFIVVLQQLDGNVLYPKIQGNSIGMSGFWIIFSLLFFGGLFGFWGMLLGVPGFAVIYAVCKAAVKARLEERGMPHQTDEYKRIYLFNEETGEPVYKSAARRSRRVAEAETNGETSENDESDKKDS